MSFMFFIIFEEAPDDPKHQNWVLPDESTGAKWAKAADWHFRSMPRHSRFKRFKSMTEHYTQIWKASSWKQLIVRQKSTMQGIQRPTFNTSLFEQKTQLERNTNQIYCAIKIKDE